MFNLIEIKKIERIYSNHTALVLMLVPMFLIISSSVYPAITFDLRNKEIAIMLEALAQLEDKDSRGDSSGYHDNIPVSDVSSSSPSPTPTTAAPSSIVSTGTANNNKDFTTQAPIGSLTARPTNNIVNTNSFYDIVFVTTSAGAIKRIQVTFPAGTTVPTSASFNEAEGIGKGTVSKSGQTLTYTVTNAVNVPASTKIRLEFANINNPLNPSANYKVTVTTRNAANGIIDGPTQSTSYTMKQIGTNAIADNAITSPKLSMDLAHVVWPLIEGASIEDIMYIRNTVSVPISYVDTFSPVTDISNNAGFSFDVSISAGTTLGASVVDVAWTDTTDTPGNSDIFFRRSIDGGASFGSTTNLSNNAGNSFDTAVSVSGNNVYIVWRDNTPGNEEILYKRSTNGGVSFGSTINLSNNAGSSGSPAISVSGNNVYIVWRDNTPGNEEILYKRSTNGGVSFGSTINLSNNAGSSGRPAVAASGNNVYLVWEDATPANLEIFYRRSINGGASFGAPDNLSNNSGNSFEPAIAAIGNNAYVVWADSTPGNGEIFYRKSTNGGGTFGSTINLTNNAASSSDFPAIAASGNNVYVVWRDTTPEALEVSYMKSTNDGTRFGGVVTLFSGIDTPALPAIAAFSNLT